jgi:hypothetical protein
MKKSQLRKIIKESIKELITEQTVTGKPIMSTFCSFDQTTGSSRRYIVDDNGTLRNPQIGDIICWPAGPNTHNFSAFQQYGCHREIEVIMPNCNGCPPPIGNGSGMCSNSCLNPPVTVKLLTGCDDDSCCGGTPAGQECLSCSEHRPFIDRKFDKPTMIRKR